MLEPIYTLENCRFVGQFNWGLSVFWRSEIQEAFWLEPLAAAVRADGIQINKHRFAEPGVSQFELETGPNVSPFAIVQRVKGRLQYLVRQQMPKPFKKNYAIRSIGYVTRSIIEKYVARQTARHRMADNVVQRQLEELQICQPGVDLSQPQTTSHAIYWYNLHLTIVNDGRWPVVRHETLLKLRDSILAVSRAKGHRLSRGGILPDHFHLPLGCPLAATPAEIALCYLNNLAYVYDMKPVFQFGAHLRTFSEYDLGAVEGQRPFGGRVVH